MGQIPVRAVSLDPIALLALADLAEEDGRQDEADYLRLLNPAGERGFSDGSGPGYGCGYGYSSGYGSGYGSGSGYG